MKQQKKFFYRVVAGLLLSGFVCWGVQAASYELTRKSARIVASQNIKNYTITVSESAVNPGDHINSLGVHSDGYYYTCAINKGGTTLSTMVIRKWKGYRASNIEILPIKLLRQGKVMAEIQFSCSSVETTMCDCIITQPAPDDVYDAGIINWRAIEISGA
jgi:hypothetical protein